MYTRLVYEEAHKHKHRETANKLMPVCIHFSPWSPESCINTFAIMGFCEIAASSFISSGYHQLCCKHLENRDSSLDVCEIETFLSSLILHCILESLGVV